MALPPGFMDELRDRLSLAQVVGRKVSWDARKSNPAKGDYWAPCPFHQEKTASFHVDDQKGFYHCFGCKAKGDAISFVRDTENVGFMDAVEILAREAGIPMPAQDPAAQARSDANQTLIAVMEQAVQYYRMQLRTAQGQGARDYLGGRGIDEAIQTRFEIGLAPPGWSNLTEALLGKGVDIAHLVEVGLSIVSEKSGKPFDRFRNRVMFPIRDARGRAVAFGGRILDGGTSDAKYLNSPETPLFHKGRTLYNVEAARRAAGQTGKLVVTEGYVDVIALARVGLDHAVAPLGTAITEQQLRMIWRIADEPVVALDGDTAGRQAALRLIELALPILEAGKSLLFATMPDGQDPDDVIRSGGLAAIQAQLGAARPMIDLLWENETSGKTFDAPERRAALDAALRKRLNTIADPSIRGHYEAGLRERRAELFRSRSSPPKTQRPSARGSGGSWRTPVPLPSAGTRSSLLARQNDAPGAQTRVRESGIIYLALTHPKAAAELEESLETLPILNQDLDRLRLAMLSSLDSALASENPSTSLPHAVGAQTGSDPVTFLRGCGAGIALGGLEPPLPHDQALEILRDAISLQRASAGAAAELHDAQQNIGDTASEAITWRLAEAARSIEEARTAGFRRDDNATEEEESSSQTLDSFIRNEIWVKKKR